MDGQMDRRTDGWTYRQNRWTDGWMNVQIDGWVEGWTDGHVNR